jgi:hypothetical protein
MNGKIRWLIKTARRHVNYGDIALPREAYQ